MRTLMQRLNLFMLEEEAGGGQGGPPADSPKPVEPKTFTQEEMDRVVGDRLARERAKYEGFDDLKKKAAEFDKQQEAQLSELEREKKAREAAEKTAADATARANNALIDSALITAAAGTRDPDAVRIFARESGTVTVGDDGQVTGAAEAVTNVLAAKEYLVGSRSPGPGDGGAQPTPRGAGSLDQQIAEASNRGDWALVNTLNAQKAFAIQT